MNLTPSDQILDSFIRLNLSLYLRFLVVIMQRERFILKAGFSNFSFGLSA